jgi:hypothetical protein
MSGHSWKQARGKLGHLSKTADPTDPRLADLRRDIRAGRLEEHVQQVISAVPALTDEQRERLTDMLRP